MRPASIVFAALLAVFFCTPAFAAFTATPRGPLQAYQDTSGVWKVGTALEVTDGVTTRYTRATSTLSIASAAKLARSAMGGPLGLGILAATAFQNYQWDDTEGDFKTADEPFAELVDVGLGPFPDNASKCASLGTVWIKDDGDGTFTLRWAGYFNSGDDHIGLHQGGWSIAAFNICDMPDAHGHNPGLMGKDLNSQSLADAYEPPIIEGEVLTDEQLSDAVFSDTGLVEDLVADSINRGTYADDFPELATVADSVAAAFDAGTFDGVSTVEPPSEAQELELEFPCGGPGLPPCDVLVDETGTPEAEEDQFAGVVTATGIDDFISGIGDDVAPDATGIEFALPASGTCQTISASFLGYDFDVPGVTGCARLEELKNYTGYALYLFTAIYLFHLAVRRPA